MHMNPISVNFRKVFTPSKTLYSFMVANWPVTPSEPVITKGTRIPLATYKVISPALWNALTVKGKSSFKNNEPISYSECPTRFHMQLLQVNDTIRYNKSMGIHPTEFTLDMQNYLCNFYTSGSPVYSQLSDRIYMPPTLEALAMMKLPRPLEQFEIDYFNGPMRDEVSAINMELDRARFVRSVSSVIESDYVVNLAKFKETMKVYTTVIGWLRFICNRELYVPSKSGDPVYEYQLPPQLKQEIKQPVPLPPPPSVPRVRFAPQPTDEQIEAQLRKEIAETVPAPQNNSISLQPKRKSARLSSKLDLI